MRKILLVIAAILLSATFVNATSVVCTVTEVDPAILPESTHNNLVLECDSVDGFEQGQLVKVKIKKVKDKKVIEGC